MKVTSCKLMVGSAAGSCVQVMFLIDGYQTAVSNPVTVVGNSVPIELRNGKRIDPNSVSTFTDKTSVRIVSTSTDTIVSGVINYSCKIGRMLEVS